MRKLVNIVSIFGVVILSIGIYWSRMNEGLNDKILEKYHSSMELYEKIEYENVSESEEKEIRLELDKLDDELKILIEMYDE